MSQDNLYTTRREFLSGSFGLLSAATTMPLFLGNTISAMADDSPLSGKGDGHRILVVVQLAGGNDGLNTIVPYSMDPYYKLRRTLAIKKDECLKLEDGMGLHPAAAGLKDLFDDGKMAVVQGVGYPNPDRSHFTSTDIWHSADPKAKSSGWLGRYFDSCCNGKDPDPEPIEGVAISKESPLMLQGDKFSALAFDNPDTLRWNPGKNDRSADEVFRKLNNIHGDFPQSGSELEQFLQRAALKAQVGAEDIRAATAGEKLTGGKRGGRFGQSLQIIAKMIRADMPTRVYYATMGGFDTHTGQAGRHERLMREFGDGMKSFLDTLKRDKLDERVLVVTFSEFGRRVQENASGGTDHGEAAPMFLFGNKVKPGLHQRHPDLTQLRRGDLKYGTDFRKVYSAVLRDWMKVRPERILGGNFAPLRLLNR